VASPARTPSPRRRRSAVRAPLDVLVGTQAKTALLRILTIRGAPTSQRELARRARIQVRSAQQALNDFVALGVVTRTVGGRDHLVALNPRHRLAPALSALFAAEAEQFLAVRQRLTAVATAGPERRRIVSLALFGSVARGDDGPTSDVDVVVIARDAAGRDGVADRLRAARDNLVETVGADVRVVAYTLSEARARWRRRVPLFVEIVRDGIPLVGPPLAEVLTGDAD